MKRSPLKRTKPIRKQSGRAIRYQDLDSMCRSINRSKCLCEASGVYGHQCEGILEWAHIISREYLSTRWFQLNHLCLCSYHHRLLHESPDLIHLLVDDNRFQEIRSRTVPMSIDEWIEEERSRLRILLSDIS